MAWTFPEDRSFDLVTKEAQYINCRFVASDADHVTVDRDYLCVLGRIHRLRTQVAVETIQAVHEHAITGVREDADHAVRGNREDAGARGGMSAEGSSGSCQEYPG